MIKRILLVLLACAFVPGCGILKKRKAVDSVQVQRQAVERSEQADSKTSTDKLRDVEVMELTFRLPKDRAPDTNVKDIREAVISAARVAEEVSVKIEQRHEEIQQQRDEIRKTDERKHAVDSAAVKTEDTYYRKPSPWGSLWTWGLIAGAVLIVYFAVRKWIRLIWPF